MRPFDAIKQLAQLWQDLLRISTTELNLKQGRNVTWIVNDAECRSCFWSNDKRVEFGRDAANKHVARRNGQTRLQKMVANSFNGECASQFCALAFRDGRKAVRDLRYLLKDRTRLHNKLSHASLLLIGALADAATRIVFDCTFVRVTQIQGNHRVAPVSQLILISFSTSLNSGSPVTNSAFLSLARAAPKQSA